MSQLVQPIADLFRFNSKMVSIALADLAPEDAVRRWKKGEGSSITYLVGHLRSSRNGLMLSLGTVDENPYKELFGADVGSRDGSEYPPLEELRAGWEATAADLDRTLAGVSDEDALRTDDTGFPTPDKTLRGRLAFVAWHETYHVGQMGLLRTEMGYPSLRQALYAVRGG